MTSATCWARAASSSRVSARRSRTGRSGSRRRARMRSPVAVPPGSRVSTAPRSLGQPGGLGGLAGGLAPLEDDQPPPSGQAPARFVTVRALAARSVFWQSPPSGPAGAGVAVFQRRRTRLRAWPPSCRSGVLAAPAFLAARPPAFLARGGFLAAPAFLAVPRFLAGPGPGRVEAGGPPVRQQLDRPLRGDAVDGVALAQGGVGRPVGHVGPEPPLPEQDGAARRRGRCPAPAAARRPRPAPAGSAAGRTTPAPRPAPR